MPGGGKKRRPTKRIGTGRGTRPGGNSADQENRLSPFITESLRKLDQWQRRWPAFDVDETLKVPASKIRATLDELTKRLKDNYPFFHPAYAGQMLKPPHPIASIAYFLTQQINPNNHALDGGPATASMELEVIDQLATMFGYRTHLGHLTSSGTIANLEALWVARSLHPDKPGFTFPTWGPSIRLDYVFAPAGGAARLRSCEVVDGDRVKEASDHLPLLAQVD